MSNDRIERLETAIRRVRAIASDALSADDAASGKADADMLRQDMADILTELSKAGV